MANNQIRISKNPRRGAQNFWPLEIMTIRMVPRDTSSILDMKIRNGSRTKVKKEVSKKLFASIILGDFPVKVFKILK